MIKRKCFIFLLAFLLTISFGFTHEVSLAATYEIAYGTWASPGEAAYEGMELFKELVEEETDGDIVVHLYPADALGSTGEQIEQASMNEIQMVSSGWSGLDKIEYLSLPYLMRSWEGYDDILLGELGDEWNEELIEMQNLRMIGILPRSPRILSSNEPIYHPDDMDGLNFRVPERDYYVQSFEAFGANPVTISFGEVYTALETGTVVGQENPIETIYAAGFHEVQDYIILIDYILKPAFVVINNDFYGGLSEEYQLIISEAQSKAQDYTAELMEKQQVEFLEAMEEEGVEIIEPDLEPFIEITENVREELGIQAWGEELYKEILEIGHKY